MNKSLALLALALLSTSDAYSQGADPLFTGSVVYVGDTMQFQKVLDLDHDGVDEILSAYWVDTNARDQLHVSGVDFRDGADFIPWSFDTPVVGYTCTIRGPMAGTGVGDLDGDGWDDFVIVVRDKAFFYATRAGAAPVLLSTVEWGLFYSAYRYICADVTGDGLDDFIAVGQSVEMWRNDGGTFTSLGRVGQSTIHYGFTASATAIDLDGDGVMEIANRSNSNSSQRVTFTHYEGSSVEYAGFVNYDVPANSEMTVGDVDGDGDDDIVMFHGLSETYQVLRADGQGAFAREPVRSGGPATHLLDLDGDGDLDGLCCGSGSLECNQDNSLATTYRVCLNDGTGSFDVSIARAGVATGFDGLAGLLDFDGDGDLDPIGGRTVLVNHERVGQPYCSPAINSTGAVGVLSAFGSGSLGRSDLVLEGTDLPAQQTTMLLLAGRRGNSPLGPSTLCLAAPLVRQAIATTDSRRSGFVPDAGDGLPGWLPRRPQRAGDAQVPALAPGRRWRGLQPERGGAGHLRALGRAVGSSPALPARAAPRRSSGEAIEELLRDAIGEREAGRRQPVAPARSAFEETVAAQLSGDAERLPIVRAVRFRGSTRLGRVDALRKSQPKPPGLG